MLLKDLCSGPNTLMGVPYATEIAGPHAAVLGIPSDVGTHPCPVGWRAGPAPIRGQSPPVLHSNPGRFVYFSAKDFFYLPLRDPRPALPPDTAWEPTPAQPAPRWMPGIFTATRALADGSSARVTSIDTSRVRFALRGGRAEPALQQSRTDLTASTLTPREGEVVLGAVELGAARSTGSPRGLRIDGRARMLFPTRPGAGVLGVTNASMSLQESDSDAPDAVQGVALLLRGADAGDLVWERRAHLVVAHTRDHRTLLVETDGSAAAVSGPAD